MVQKEVAQRICSKPPNMSLLAVSVQFYAKPKIISNIPKECFWPSPKVDSAVIKITPFKQFPAVQHPQLADVGQPETQWQDDTFRMLFFKIVKAGFLHPRKQLANNLSTSLKKDKKEINLWLLKNKINPSQRAETLSIENWIYLAKSL